jgi:hypothetical protein
VCCVCLLIFEGSFKVVLSRLLVLLRPRKSLGTPPNPLAWPDSAAATIAKPELDSISGGIKRATD